MLLQLDDLEIDLLRKKYYVTIEGSSFVSTNFNGLCTLLEEANIITKVQVIGYNESDPSLFTSIVNLISPKSYEVDLNSNLLKKHGIAIAQILASSDKITKVNLSNNAFKENGAKVLAVLASESITDINLDNNWIRSFDERVLDRFKSYSSLHHIDLSDNDLDGLVGVNSDTLEVIL